MLEVKVRSKTLGHLLGVSQSRILHLPDGKIFLGTLLMLVSPEHLQLSECLKSRSGLKLQVIWEMSVSPEFYTSRILVV